MNNKGIVLAVVSTTWGFWCDSILDSRPKAVYLPDVGQYVVSGSPVALAISALSAVGFFVVVGCICSYINEKRGK